MNDNYVLLLSTLVGSRGYGLETEASDYDYKLVTVEPFRAAMGFSTFEQKEVKGSGYESVTYSLRKFIKLALKGNPTMLEMLFVKPAPALYKFEHEFDLHDLIPFIVSKRASSAYLGYMQQQRKKLLAGYGAEGVRKELVDKYGFDTKFAMHLLRLAFQGIELLETGKLVLPLEGEKLEMLRGCRDGHLPLPQLLTYVQNLEGYLKSLIDASLLRAEPDVERVEGWMLDCYERVWSLG